MAFRDKSDLSVLLPACLLGRILKRAYVADTLRHLRNSPSQRRATRVDASASSAFP